MNVFSLVWNGDLVNDFHVYRGGLGVLVVQSLGKIDGARLMGYDAHFVRIESDKKPGEIARFLNDFIGSYSAVFRGFEVLSPVS